MRETKMCGNSIQMEHLGENSVLFLINNTSYFLSISDSTLHILLTGHPQPGIDYFMEDIYYRAKMIGVDLI